MTRSDWKDTFEAIGVFAIVASLIFVAFEIRTNTASNQIAIEQNYSSNWLTINALIAENHGLAEVFEKGLAGEDMTRAEARQFNGLVSMYLTQSFHMLRLYDQGLVTEDEARSAFRVQMKLDQPFVSYAAEPSKDILRVRLKDYLTSGGGDSFLTPMGWKNV
jgi:hypothetical protein